MAEWDRVSQMLHWIVASTSGKVIPRETFHPMRESKPTIVYETAESLRAEYEANVKVKKKKGQKKL